VNTERVIVSFRHRGLKELYEGVSSRRVSANHVGKLRRILSALDQAEFPEDMDLPGYRLHPLKGRQKGHFSVWVSENWRVTFRFEGINVADVDYLDYHLERCS
jgi:proteic killer suppression protein